MTPEEKLLRKIRFQAEHRGSKEMDFIVSGGVRFYLKHRRSLEDLKKLNEFLCRDDADLQTDMSQGNAHFNEILNAISEFKKSPKQH